MIIKTSILLIALFFCSSSYAVTPYHSPRHDKVVKYLNSGQEKTVFEAVWFNPNYLKVTRFNTGSSQNGFAQYLCSVLSDDFGFRGKRTDIEIIDVVKLTQNKEWKVLGKATCH